MSKFLKLPIMFKTDIDGDVNDDGVPFVHVFVTADFNLKLTAEQYERYQYSPGATIPQEVRALTIEERLEQIRQSLREVSEQPDRPAGWVSDEDVEIRNKANAVLGVKVEEVRDTRVYDVAAASNADNIDEMFSEIEMAIPNLDLRVDKEEVPNVKVNEEAGPDGHALTTDQWKAGIKVLIQEIPSGVAKGSDRHKSIMRAKRAVMYRLRALTYYQLMEFKAITPQWVRLQITEHRVKGLGENDSNFIPASWAQYIEEVPDMENFISNIYSQVNVDPYRCGIRKMNKPKSVIMDRAAQKSANVTNNGLFQGLASEGQSDAARKAGF